MLSSFKVSTVALKGSQVSITLTPLTTQVSKQTHQRSMVMSEDHIGGYRMALCHEIPMCIPIKPLCSCVCIFKLTSHIIYGKSKLQHFFPFLFVFFTKPSLSLFHSYSVPVTGSVCLCTCASCLCDHMVSFLYLSDTNPLSSRLISKGCNY